MTVAGLIKVIQRVLVGDILYSGSDKAYRLTFITTFGIRVVVAYCYRPRNTSSKVTKLEP